MADGPLDLFHPAVRAWFCRAFPAPTRPQQLGWPAIARGESTLILAPTGSGKTLTAFLWCLNRLMFGPAPPPRGRCRVLYISPLKALASDVERNLRAPLAGIAAAAEAEGMAVTLPQIAIRTGDTPAGERARFLRDAADLLITTPESLFLLLTSRARERLAHVDTVIVDEIHALVPSKRGAHLALSLERLEALRAAGPPEGRRYVRSDVVSRFSRTIQRIGLSATQRPLDEVARFLGGAVPRRATRRHHAPSKSTEADLHDEFGEDDTAQAYRPVTIVDTAEKKAIKLTIEVPIEETSRSDPPSLAGPLSGRATGRPRRGGPPMRTAQPALARRVASRPDLAPAMDERTAEAGRSIWASIHPRLLELIRAHRSTLLFVNSRRLAERLAGALNDLAGEPLVRSHHGSLARDARNEVEDLLKAGRIRALVATSSLELGIDMGAIDLVVQIEAPPSVASGLQRLGRAGHQAGALSEGIVFPKFRGDLVACAAVARAVHDGSVEATRYPRNPLDVLAQQIVAIASTGKWEVDEVFALVRRAAPFATLSRRMFEGVLDMLSGRYPSDEFAALRPRITWDRVRHTVVGREGAARIAIANAGTIPDRGLYGVFLAGAARPTRVGELDEEMVFETKVGETFTLGASTWRVEEITHDRVLVSPAPGEPGKTPFWHGDQAGRPIELGYAIGRLVRELREMPPGAAIDRLVRQHDLDATAAEHLIHYLDDQASSGAVPDDRTIVIERCLDELGDWRVCLLSPLGSRVHAPWAMAATAEIRERTGMDVEVMWGDEGFVVRFPDATHPPDPALLLPAVDRVEALVVRQLGSTSLFAARFREAAARALLLPRRRPGLRTPLWQQRKRASDLLAVASRYGSFPALLETYRELLRDHFDMAALVDTLRKISTRTLHVATIDSRGPSPFAASLLFSYVANYIYDGDAPLAERRAQALSVDHAQLRELIGDAELRELLDPEALEAVERQLQGLDDRYKVRKPDGLHDLLIRIGDLSVSEIAARSSLADTQAVIRELEASGRIVPLRMPPGRDRATKAPPDGGEVRYVAVEDVARYRDALGIALPSGLPEALLESVRDPAGDIAMRYARSHGPFTARELAARYRLPATAAETLLVRLTQEGRLIEGEFRPGGTEREWIEESVLRTLRRRSLARLRREVEPVDADALGRFLVSWHGIPPHRAGVRDGGPGQWNGRRGPEALLDAVEQLQGAAIPASVLETEVLPARVEGYQPALLDMLMAAGEVVWVGVEPLGDRDGRVALYLSDHLSRLRPPAASTRESRDPSRPRGGRVLPAFAEGSGEASPERANARAGGSDPAMRGRGNDIVEYLKTHGASFFGAIHEGTGGGFPGETVDALWDLVWRGLVTNDTLHALRAFLRSRDARVARPPALTLRRSSPANEAGARPGTPFRTRRLVPPKAEGRWSVIDPPGARLSSVTEWSAAIAAQLLTRFGIVTRETVAAEAVAGGFSAVYQVLKAMEEAGRIRRGYFVAGLGAAQFAIPAAVDVLRAMRDVPETPRTVVLSATDPANPYGATVRWPASLAAAPRDRGGPSPEADDAAGRGPTRSAGARVILVDGFLAAYLRRGERELLLFVPEAEPRRTQVTREVARMLRHVALAREEGRRGMLLGEINGQDASAHPVARAFIDEGFTPTALGLQVRPGVGVDLKVGLYPGTAIAGPRRGGAPMAQQSHTRDDLVDTTRKDDTRETEHERVRSSNDRDQALERAGESAPHSRGYDDAIRGRREPEVERDVDPDLAEADVDRDDTPAE